MKISSAVNSYIQFRHSANLREATLAHYSCVLSHLMSFFRQQHYIDCEQIDGAALQGYMVHRRTVCKIADKTAETEHVIVLGFIRWCIACGYVASIDFKNTVPRPKSDQHTPRWLTQDEYKQILQAARIICRRYGMNKARDYAALLVLTDTGLRKGEFLRLNIDDVNWKERSIRVSASSKSRKERTVFFGVRAARACRLYLEERGYTWADGRPVGDCTLPLWASRQNNRMAPGRLWNIIKEIAQLAGLDGVHCHTMRHSNCSMLLNQNMPITEVQGLMGHARIQTTMIYSHLDTRVMREHYKDACPGDTI